MSLTTIQFQVDLSDTAVNQVGRMGDQDGQRRQTRMAKGEQHGGGGKDTGDSGLKSCQRPSTNAGSNFLLSSLSVGEH